MSCRKRPRNCARSAPGFRRDSRRSERHRTTKEETMPALETLPVADGRAGVIAGLALQPPPPAVGHVINRAVPGPGGDIPVRIYQPFGTGPFPLTMYFHGGGFVIGNLDTHDGLCRHLCLAAHCVVMAVDYRLAPEHKFPAAHDDCLAATKWAAANAGMLGIDPRRIALAGDSAGGNLTAATAISLRDGGGPTICAQLLDCPWLDYDTTTSSYRENGAGYFLTLPLMKWFEGHYLHGAADRDDPRAAPLKAKDLRGLPPAYVLTAQFDPLRDEGEAYADKLAAAGVTVVRKRYSDMIHAFPGLSLNVVSTAAEEIAAHGAWLKARFASV